MSISGTNGKSTVTRLMSHILLLAGRRVGTTTSDGVLVDERMVEPGDWTGRAAPSRSSARRDLDVAVLETARGGMVLRGVGYESNDASVLTNVSSDHLDLQGIHTLPELAEVKSTICRITKPDGWVVLNGDDPYVSAVARRVQANVAYFSLLRRRRVAASSGATSSAAAGRTSSGAAGWSRRTGRTRRTSPRSDASRSRSAGWPATTSRMRWRPPAARAASGATIAEVRDGLMDFRPDAAKSPGRLNLFRLGSKVIIVDFAHNEAGISAVLDVAEGIAGGAAGRAAPITVIIGTAGDRPDDTLRGIGKIAAERAQRVAVKQTLGYLRGRTPESVVGRAAGRRRRRRRRSDGRADLRLRDGRAAGRTERRGRRSGGRLAARRGPGRRADVPLRARPGLRPAGDLGARPVDVTSELTELVPRLQERPRRG